MSETDLSHEDLPELMGNPRLHFKYEAPSPSELTKPLSDDQTALLTQIRESGDNGFDITSLTIETEANLNILFARGLIKIIISAPNKTAKIS